MTDENSEQQAVLAAEGRLVVAVTKTLFDKNVDGAFRVLGEYLDENDLQLSAEVIEEYRHADRIKPPIN